MTDEDILIVAACGSQDPLTQAYVIIIASNRKLIRWRRRVSRCFVFTFLVCQIESILIAELAVLWLIIGLIRIHAVARGARSQHIHVRHFLFDQFFDRLIVDVVHACHTLQLKRNQREKSLLFFNTIYIYYNFNLAKTIKSRALLSKKKLSLFFCSRRCAGNYF